MGDEKQPAIGAITWADLTVADAPRMRDFYREVVGWSAAELDMGGYADYCMSLPEGGATVAGICHARGFNADLPPQWLLYITVADLDHAIERCTALGGAVVVGPREMGSYGRLCVVRDPAGAVAALICPPRD
jgi:hypothetical protein